MVAITLLVVLPYLSPVLAPFAFFDDYMNLDNAQRPDGLVGLFAAQGRPLMGAALEASFLLAGDISGVMWIRMATMIGLVAFAWAAQWLLLDIGWPLWSATTAAALLALLPSAQVVVCWATLCVCPFLALFSIGAFAFGDRAGRSGQAIGARCLFAALAILCLLPAGMTYQSFVLFHCCFILAWALSRETTSVGSRIRGLLIHAGILVAAGIITLLALQIATSVSDQPVDHRVAATTDPLGKLAWFISEPSRNAFAPFWLAGGHTIWALLQIAGIWMLILLALVRVVQASGLAAGILSISATLGLCVVSYAPNLIVSQDWASYRSIYPLASCAVIAALWAAGRVAGTMATLRNVHICLLAAACVGASALAWSRSVEYFARPQVEELVRFRALMDQAQFEDGDHCFLRLASWQDSLGPRAVYDEFGYTSSANPDSATGLFWQVLRESCRKEGRVIPKVTLTLGSTAPRGDPSVHVIDMSRALSRPK
jgi:hypothetical protein